MKKKIFSVLFALVLVLSLMLVTAVPAAVAANGDGNTLEVSKWTEDVANPIFDPVAKAYYPTVVKVSDTDYRMWYGSDSGVGYATSPDGLTWTEVSNPVNGLANANHPLVEYIDGKFSIWYWDTGVSIYGISALRYAESDDGANWSGDQALTQDGTYKLITGAGTGWSSGSYGPGDVIYNPSGSNTLDDTNIWNNKYVIYYMSTNGGNEYIGLAYSVDGKHWKRYGDAPVLSPCTEADDPNVGWDYRSVGYPTVIKDADGMWHMWFCGGPGTNHGIGYAWSNDGISWAKVSNSIFHKDDGVSWRTSRTYCPMVTEDGGIYKMWFSGKDTAGNYAIGYATADGPFPTIQAAIDAATTGDTIIVAAGTYNEDLVVNKGITLTAENPPTSSSTIVGTVDITTDGATFKWFKVTPGSVFGHEAAIAVYASNVTVDGNLIDGITGDGTGTVKGIFVYSAGPSIIGSIDIINNQIRNVDNPLDGVVYGGSVGIMVQGVVAGVNVLNNTIDGVHSAGWAYGIEITPTAVSGSTPPQNVVVEGNSVSTINDGSVYTNAPYPNAPYPGVCFFIDKVSGVNVDASTITAHYNDFINTPVGVAFNWAVGPNLDATLNWWGDISGPSGIGQGSGTAVLPFVDYDPWIGQGGMVTGGGWIYSPAGAYKANPELEGKATFGFVSKYKKGAAVPTGNTQFNFQVADLNFHSDSYDWLVIAGDKAMYKGTGTINGAGNYGFMLSAIDGDTDKFRIRIWDIDTDTLIYDNKTDSVHETVLSGGRIVIHKK